MRAEEPGSESQQQPGEGRESIWSIQPARRALYFALFTVYALAGLGFLIWYEIFEKTSDTWPQTIHSITQGIGINTVGAAGLALLTIEGPKTVMVVADYITERWLNPLKERRRQEAEQRRQEAEQRRQQAREEAEGRLAKIRAEGRAEGEAQNQAAWVAWNERRMTAEANGEPFDEPPPELPAEPKQDDDEPPPGTQSDKSE